jgi:hypothetical protein
VIAHEVTRVFHDRLICPEDRLLFYQFLSDNLHDYFKVGNLVTKLGSICIKLKLEWDKKEEKSIFWAYQSVVENSGHFMGKQTSYVVPTNNN